VWCSVLWCGYGLVRCVMLRCSTVRYGTLYYVVWYRSAVKSRAKLWVISLWPCVTFEKSRYFEAKVILEVRYWSRYRR